MVRAFLALGSNIGDRAAYLRAAIERLHAADLRVTGRSRVYETVPWGVTGQATYLNQVIGVETALAPRTLLGRCRAVEAALGRVRGVRWGPRTVDVDVLVYGDAVIREPDLVVPHADLARRAFVLVPLAELAPGLRLPGGTDVASLAAGLPDRDTVWVWDDADAGTVGREVRWYDSLPSTNEAARDLAEAGEAEGIVVVADEQTAGRGRLGRTWASPRGGLWLSIVLRPPWPAVRIPAAGLAASEAVAEAVEATARLRARVKWPNDVLVGGRKVAGLLLEAGPIRGAAAVPEWVVLGIGINANVPPRALPPRPQYPATSLEAVLGRPVERGPLLRAVLRLVNRDYAALRRDGGGAEVLRRWRERSDTLGCLVQIATTSGTLEGRAYDIDETGALLLRTLAGAERRVLAGDITGEVRIAAAG
jgi:BirA family biotin operon repressor/biotin-[acetyl-CoA-carboxylase] ligase